MSTAEQNKRVSNLTGRIFGLETEYAVLYQPDDPADSLAPPFPLIEEVLFASLLDGHKAAQSLMVKGGYFLENGGLAHLEIYIHEQADTPIFELATPECTNPRDLLLYQRAFDTLLTTTSDRSWKAFIKLGYQGRIAFGKNNLDSKGVGYGCHENYLIRHDRQSHEIFLIGLFLPFLFLLASPWLVLLLLSIVFYCLFVLMPPRIMSLLENLTPDLVRGLRRTTKRLGAAIPRRLIRQLRYAYNWMSNLILQPFISCYTVLLSRVAYRPLLRNLTGLLVTRSIVSGAGWLDPQTGRFELSQRAGLTRNLQKIIMLERTKTMVDLKGFLYRPLSLFDSARRLSLCLGDSNLSDRSNYLKLGTTALVMDMSEAGVDFSDLEPKDPVRAFQEVSGEGPWKEIELKSGRRKSAIEIQRECLRRAKSFFVDTDTERDRLLELWGDTLERLADNPASLASRLDWAAKKSLLDRAVLAVSNWKTFGHWCELFNDISPELLEEASSLDAVLEKSPKRPRQRIQSRIQTLALDTETFSLMRELYFQCQKIDLRYHEISCDPGYERQLESEDLLERLTTDAEVRLAIVEPPPDTRARLRGYYIKMNPVGSSRSILASWERIVFANSARSVSLADPFYYRVPTD